MKKEKIGYLYQSKKERISYLDQYVIHIPHSSLIVPDDFKKKILIDEKIFDQENLLMCDYKVDQFVPKDFHNIVKFPYSRMYCDVERYLDDKEEMSKYGMGVFYTKDSNGKRFVKRKQKEKEWIIQNLYKKHHEQLDTLVEKILKKHQKCFIIDLHSFSDEFVDKIFHKKNNPDICIGMNQNFDFNLLMKTMIHFHKYGYSISINNPYCGSIISNKHPEVSSMMLEINKRVYCNNSKDFDRFYHCMMEYYKMLNGSYDSNNEYSW